MKTVKLCFDARMARASGIGTYIQGLLTELAQRRPANLALTVLSNKNDVVEGGWPHIPVSTRIYTLGEQVLVPWAFHRSGADLLHVPHYNLPIVMARRCVVTIHDLIHLKFPQFWPSKIARAYAHFFFQQVVPRARAIISDSESTKRDLMEMVAIPGERIRVIPLGVWHDRYQTIGPEALSKFEKLGLPRDYLLYVGNLKEFKNVERLLEAYNRVKASHPDLPPLVLVGRNFIPGFEKRIADSRGVRWLGKLGQDLLPCLYKNALVFLFPSLYEGFGLPPLEAMASGTPVLCSERGSLPEVVGDAAFIVDPEKVEELAAGIERLAGSDTLRKELSAKGLRQAALFTWEKTADQTLQVYEECLAAV